MEKDMLDRIITAINEQREIVLALMRQSNIQKLELSLLKANSNSKSQFMQDLFVLQQTGYKTNGFFVEFGACDGVMGSNTFLLEREYGWKGILAEPSREWWQSLQKNRAANLDFRCVYNESNLVLEFSQTNDSMLSTLTNYKESDLHGRNRSVGETKTYPVLSVSLNDLLEFYDAPPEIDYLSIDTEGSEYEILEAFDFTKRKVNLITVEHNWTDNRIKIYELLCSNGYERVHENETNCDDWYIRK